MRSQLLAPFNGRAAFVRSVAGATASSAVTCNADARRRRGGNDALLKFSFNSCAGVRAYLLLCVVVVVVVHV